MHFYQFFKAADLLLYPFITALVATCFIGITLVYPRLRPHKERRQHARQPVEPWLVGIALVCSLFHPQKERRQHARRVLNDLLNRRNRH